MNPFKPWIGSFVLSLTTYIIRMFVREDKRGEIGCDVLFMFFSSLCNLLQYLTWKLFWFQIVNCPDSWCNARPISDPHVNNVKMFVSPCELLRDCSEKYTTKIHKYVSITRVISEDSVILDTQSNATNTFIADIFTQSIFDIFIALLHTMIQSFSIVFAGYKMPACLRPGLSSSSPLPVTWVWVSGLVCPHHWHNQTLHSLYTLSHTPYSHLLSTLSIDQWPQTNIRHWRDVEDWDYS